MTKAAVTIPQGQPSGIFDDNYAYGEFFSVGTSVLRNSNSPTVRPTKKNWANPKGIDMLYSSERKLTVETFAFSRLF